MLAILSMQASDHDTSIREFRIGPGGIRILDPADTEPGVLAGIATEHELVVQTARNGQEAYELATELRPRLVLSDLMMPVMRGDALYAALRENATTADVTFVLMTSIPTKAPSAIKSVVGKPLELAALETLLLDALGERP